MCRATPKVRFVASPCIRSHLTDFHAEPLIIEDGSEGECEDEAEAEIALGDLNANIEIKTRASVA
jgi:hypothetical protein